MENGARGGVPTQGKGVADTPSRGRPRSEKSRQAILAAASELLLENHHLSTISMDAVAERAGSSKATIYRWWPSKELLALDALFSEWAVGRPDGPDTGSLAGDLLAIVCPWARRLAARPYGSVIAAMLSRVQSDPEFAKVYGEKFLQPLRDEARRSFARAVERGEIPADTDVETAVDLLYAPFYHRVLHLHAPVDNCFASAVVDYVVAAVSRPRTPS
jgi:AcrR family transcriptional regulator